MSNSEEHINMNPNNYPEENSQLDSQEIAMADKILAEDEEIAVWSEDFPETGKIVFLSIGNTTINMPENVFYGVTRATQIASKKLLQMD